MTYRLRYPTDTQLNNQRKLNLYLTGFGQQKIVSVDEIVAALTALPAGHLKGLYGIRYDPRRETQMLLNQHLGVPVRRSSRAQFIGLSSTISIYAFHSRQECLHSLYHEIGHHVFYNIIGSSLKKRWVTELYPGNGHVSKIAAINAAEDFAESYAAFTLHKEALSRLPEKLAFLHDHVFGRDLTITAFPKAGIEI